MAFQIVDLDNIRETFTGAASATITLGGAAQNSRALSSKLTSGDTFWGVARAGAEISVGIFTYNGSTVAQTTVWYSSNGNAATVFSSSNAGEIYVDVPGRIFDELNLSAITVASATTCDIGAAQAAKIIVSGTTPITSLGTTAHKRRFVKFTGALTLTHNATSLILPGGASIATAVGDTAVFLSDSSGNWTCWLYQKANGKGVIGPAVGDITGLGTGVATFLATPSSANLAAAVTDEDGTGSLPMEATGTWTPSDQSGGGLTFSAVSCKYTRIGNMVHAYGTFTFPANASGATTLIGGLPFAVPSGFNIPSATRSNSGAVASLITEAVQGSSNFRFYNNSSGAPPTNAQMTNALVTVHLMYPIT
jgi:hypothetical protein